MEVKSQLRVLLELVEDNRHPIAFEFTCFMSLCAVEETHLMEWL